MLLLLDYDMWSSKNSSCMCLYVATLKRLYCFLMNRSSLNNGSLFTFDTVNHTNVKPH